MKGTFPIILFLFGSTVIQGQKNIDSLLPVRALSIAAPTPPAVDSFISFIRQELTPNHINTLILRVDYHYQYKSHPELVDSGALSQAEVKKIVNVCRQNKIRVIPQVNLLGHQSWANRTGKLLQAYPQFDETPHITMPVKYQWPNADSLYCKSYCPLHPEVHKIVFEIVDEICDAFETDAFHAGMDEVFYLGDKKCPRCSGKDKAALFGGEVKIIRDHLAAKKRELWIWGDRLIDGRETGLGMWEASFNNTHPAIDLIPKDVVICDWHYERADKTPVYFAMKGFNVITCSWRKPAVMISQVNDMVTFRSQSTSQMKPRFRGIMQTVWSGVPPFLRGYYNRQIPQATVDTNTAWHALEAMFTQIHKLANPE